MYRWVDHTAELELEIEAATAEEVFAEALAAFAELVRDRSDGAVTRHTVALDAADRGCLLVAWLEELVYLAETDAFVPEAVEELALRSRSVRAVVVGRRGRPRPLVKAVTYHGLRFAREADRWEAHLVLDV